MISYLYAMLSFTITFGSPSASVKSDLECILLGPMQYISQLESQSFSYCESFFQYLSRLLREVGLDRSLSNILFSLQNLQFLLKRIIFQLILKSGFLLTLASKSVFWRLLALRLDLNLGLLLSFFRSAYFSLELSLPYVFWILFQVNMRVETGTCFFILQFLLNSYGSGSLAPVSEFFRILISNMWPLKCASPRWVYLRNRAITWTVQVIEWVGW